jgi:hypothetical protein
MANPKPVGKKHKPEHTVVKYYEECELPAPDRAPPRGVGAVS